MLLMQRSAAIVAAKAALAIGLIAWLATGDRFAWSSLHGLVTPRGLALLSMAGGLVVLSQVVAAFRWHLLARPAALDLPVSSLFFVNYVGSLFNNFLPGGQGGDLVRLGLVFRAFPERKADATAILLLDRVIGVTGLCVTSAGLTLVCWTGLMPVARWGGAVVLLGGVAIFAVLWLAMAVPPASIPLLGRVLKRAPVASHALEQVRALRGRPALLAVSLLVACAAHAMSLVAVALCAEALSLATQPTGVAWAASLVMCSNMVPATPGNLGVTEVVSQEVFLLLGNDAGAALFTTYRGLVMLACLPALPLLFLDVAGVRTATAGPTSDAPGAPEPVVDAAGIGSSP